MTNSNKLLMVADQVSYCFNGDCYPDGTVERITKSGKYLYTTSGKKYVLVRGPSSNCYRSIGGNTWALVKGVHNFRNPSF